MSAAERPTDGAARLRDLLADGGTSLERHVRTRMLEAARFVRSRTRLYLDTNMWVELERASTGRGRPEAAELLDALALLVSSGRAICPVSEPLFLELFEQSDPSSRRRTAAIMDRLGLGFCLLDERMRMRMGTEIGHLLHDKAGLAVHGIDDLVWSRAAFALGFLHPHDDGMPPDLMLAVQKGVFDDMWGSDLSSVVEPMAGAPPSPLDLAPVADMLNRENDAHAHEIRSYEQAYRAEARGVAAMFGDVVEQAFARIGAHAGHVADEDAYRMPEEDRGRALRLVALALEKGRARDALRTLHVQTALHAAVRWDKRRRLVANDLLDFRHAAGALGYFDAFLTERPLRSLIAQRPLDLGRHGCAVHDGVAGALGYARTLLAQG